MMCYDEDVKLEVIQLKGECKRLRRCLGRLCAETARLRRRVDEAKPSRLQEVVRLIEELDEEYTKELQTLRQELESNKEPSYSEFVRGFSVAAAMFRLFKRKVEAHQEEGHDV